MFPRSEKVTIKHYMEFRTYWHCVKIDYQVHFGDLRIFSVERLFFILLESTLCFGLTFLLAVSNKRVALFG